MNNEILARLNTIKQERSNYNISTPEPIQENAIKNFEDKFKIFFGLEIDFEYVDFLKIHNGLDENGYQIYSSYDHNINGVEYGIFQNNELWYEDLEDFRDYIFFAESGSELFVFDKTQKKYQCLDRYNSDNIIKTFNNFSDMLLYILKLMLYEEVD